MKTKKSNEALPTGLSIIVPVYNEESYVKGVISQLKNINTNFDYEIIRGKKGKKGTLESNENAKYVPGVKGKKPLIIIDLLSLKKGVVAHEFTHIIFEQALKNNPVLAENFKKKIEIIRLSYIFIFALMYIQYMQ